MRIPTNAWRGIVAAGIAVAALAVAVAPIGAQSAKLKIVATTTQIADFAANVAGDAATVKSLLTPGADPHDYEPTTDDARAVGDADIILEHGIGLDKFVANLAKNRQPTTPVVTVTEGIALRHAEPAGHGHDAENDDPHVWFAAPNAMTMTQNIQDALTRRDPANASVYGANAARYLDELNRLDAWIFEQVARIPPENRKLVTTHDSLGYFCDRYGFTFIGSVIPSLSTEAEPAAGDIAKLVNQIRAANVKAVFAESSVNPVLAQRVAQQTGARFFTLHADTLGPPGSGAETYVGMMRLNTTTLVTALSE